VHGHRDRPGQRIDAAHIVPYNGFHQRLNNGLLLRKDIHALFDAGLLTIGPDLVVYVSLG
jgi:predicted restriction endonuclease